MDKNKWVWMPHAGHWILGSRCRFHLCTYVGGFIVSTIGECPAYGEDWKNTQKFETVGSGPQCYETMVFKAVRDKKNTCCSWQQTSGSELDCERYMTANEAAAGHMKLCKKWSKKFV